MSRIKDFIKKVFNFMLNKKEIENKLGVKVALSSSMENAMSLWSNIYYNRPYWINKTTQSANIGSAIASEFALKATMELETAVTVPEIDVEYQKIIKNLRNFTEVALAKGGLCAKAYYRSDGQIAVDMVQAESFFPLEYDTNMRITSAVFVDKIVKGETVYTKTSTHTLSPNGNYLITNKAFKKDNVSDVSAQTDLGKEIPLTDIAEWNQIQPVYRYKDMQSPMFAYFRVPGANLYDDSTPLGVSVYAKAVDQIKEADKQWSRILWEYESKETAIFADSTLFKKEGSGNNWYDVLPKGKERLFDSFMFKNDTEQFFPWSPEIRDNSLFHGFDQILKRIEYNVGLSTGTISDPNTIDKTATEIVSSKQRMYATVKDIQKALEQFLKDTVYAIVSVMILNGMTNKSSINYDVTFNWSDSIIVDKQTELQGMYQDVSAGILKPEYYLSKKYGVTVDEALNMMPQQNTEDMGADLLTGTFNDNA